MFKKIVADTPSMATVNGYQASFWERIPAELCMALTGSAVTW
jgi:hypothetical protein